MKQEEQRQGEPHYLRQKLLEAVDGDYKVKDMGLIVDVLGKLEALNASKEIILSTGLGKTVNEFRRQVTDAQLARRLRALIMKWRGQVNGTPSTGSESGPANTTAPGGNPGYSGKTYAFSLGALPSSAMSNETAKNKCKNFLSFLLELSAKQNQTMARNVKNLIQGLIDGKMNEEDFEDRLRKGINSQPQPCLVGFLKKSLPYLRHSLATNGLKIEGIKPPPLSTLVPPAPVPGTSSSTPGPGGTTSTKSSVPSSPRSSKEKEKKDKAASSSGCADDDVNDIAAMGISHPPLLTLVPPLAPVTDLVPQTPSACSTKASTEIENVLLEEALNERAEEEMELSDLESDSSGHSNKENGESPRAKKMRLTGEDTGKTVHQLQEENDALKCQLDESKNEADLIKADLRSELEMKDQQLRSLQQQLVEIQSKGHHDQAINGVNEMEAKLLAIVSTFLHIHPFGASLDYTWSYAQKVLPMVRPNQIEDLMTKFPSLFKQEVSGIGATLERKWVFVGFS